MAISLSYPPTLAPGLAEILGQPCFVFIPYAHLWREGGVEIPTKAESEQAYFIDKHLRLYMKHGEKWREEFGNEVEAMVKKVRTTRVDVTK